MCKQRLYSYSPLRKIGCGKVPSILITSFYRSKSKQQHDEKLQADEFHTFARNKENKLQFIDVYAPETKEAVAYVWDKHDFAAVKKLQNTLTQLGVSFTTVAADDWKSFQRGVLKPSAFNWQKIHYTLKAVTVHYARG